MPHLPTALQQRDKQTGRPPAALVLQDGVEFWFSDPGISSSHVKLVVSSSSNQVDVPCRGHEGQETVLGEPDAVRTGQVSGLFSPTPTATPLSLPNMEFS